MIESLILQIGAVELRGMLRADAVGLALGALLAVAGFLALVLSTLARARLAGPLWLGVFALVYGLRLLARTPTFRYFFDLPHETWDYVAAALTYLVPLPFVLYARSIIPSWRRFTSRSAVGLATFAAGAIASDALQRQPYSATTVNSFLAIGFLIVLLGWLFRPGQASTRELWVGRVGGLAWALTALADNLDGMHVLSLPGPDLEPFGFIVLVTCLGTLAAWRVVGESRRLVAIDRELGIAREIQASILPQAMPRTAGLTVAARYRPMTAVAGDFYDFVEMEAARLGVLVADVSGHGVPAALIASMVKVALAAQQEHADHPAEVLAGMNRALCGRLGGQYVTAAYVVIDGRSGLLRYAAAGHPPMLRSSRRDGGVQEIEQNGLPLGIVEAAGYEETERQLDAGDRLLLYTDGLVEAPNPAEEFFGLERVMSALAAAVALAPEGAADALVGAMDAWSEPPARDDLTLVIVDWTGGADAGGLRTAG